MCVETSFYGVWKYRLLYLSGVQLQRNWKIVYIC